MNGSVIKRMLVNLGLVLLIVFPLWYATLWLIARVGEGPQEGNQWLEAGMFYFAVLAPQLLAGGLVQQLVLFGVPASWPPAQQRTAAVLSTAIIFGILIVFGGSPRFVAPMIVGLLVYGLVLRVPRGQD